jgi:hypothetical protein
LTAATRDRVLLLAAIALGVAGWWGTAALVDRREAWDAPEYFQIALPLTGILLALFGYLGSRAAWRWPLLVFGAQLATMTARNGEVGSLFPLGALLFLFFAGLGLLPTYLGVALRRARQKRQAARFAADARRAAFTAGSDEPRS